MATKKKATKKKATKKPRARASGSTKKPKKKTAVDLITVGITPPWLAPESMAETTYKMFGNKATRPPPEELAVFPWFRQDEAYQVGYYMLTHGLREHADHPEIELCNVPGVFIPAATGLLNWIADYVLEGGRLAHGESMQMSDDYLKVIAFKEIAPHSEGTDHDNPVLRVMFLC
jgi:hypothetical protein